MFNENSGIKLLVSVQHIVNLWTLHSRQKMTEKHRSVNNVLWKVVEGRIRRGRVAGRMRPAGRQLDGYAI